MAFQSNSSFKTFFDTVTQPLVKATPQYLSKHSKVLEFLFRPVGESGGKPAMGIPTQKNRFVKVEMNANYALTSDKLSKYNIQYGDTKVPEKQRNLIYAEFNAVDKGFTMGITREDLQRVKSYGGGTGMENWILDYWKKEMAGFAQSLTNSIYNGDGASAVRWDGQAKPDFDGLKTIVGTSALGGKSTSDYGEWKGQVFDLTDAATLTKLGVVSSDIDSVSELVTVPTGKKQTRFYEILNKIRKIVNNLTTDDEYLIVMNPSTYSNLWLPSLDANSNGYESRFAGGSNDALETRDNVTKFGNTTIAVENTRVPTDSIGTSSTYVLPSDTIYILTKSSLHLVAEESANFLVSDWVDMPSQYGVMQKSIEATLLFYPTSRFNLAKITLPAAVKTELDASMFL